MTGDMDAGPERFVASPDDVVCIGDHDFVVWGDVDPDSDEPFQIRVANGASLRQFAMVLHHLSHEVLEQAELQEMAGGADG
jgi:hypothetical protein